mmetsp:Transcript_7109/g.26145  ORF Transcript_7109/g.26145 Transcript_7109/m.26145 type:complete len:106 (-) Transcript_7109:1043-1360(-)
MQQNGTCTMYTTNIWSDEGYSSGTEPPALSGLTMQCLVDPALLPKIFQGLHRYWRPSANLHFFLSIDSAWFSQSSEARDSRIIARQEDTAFIILTCIIQQSAVRI